MFPVYMTAGLHLLWQGSG